MSSSGVSNGIDSLDEQSAMLADTFGVGHTDLAPPKAPEQEQKGLIHRIVQEQERAASERFDSLWRGLDLILRHHGVPLDVLDNAEVQIRKYLTHNSESTFLSRAKYLLALFMAVYTHSELPPSPDVAYAATGIWKRWIRTRMAVSVKNTHLWYSWFQAKRCAETLSEEMILLTYKKHRIAMGKPDPISDSTKDRVMAELKPLLRELNRKLLQVYRDTDWSVWDEAEDCEEARHVASLRACYEASRARGGQMGALKDLLYSDKLNGSKLEDREEFHNHVVDHVVVQPVTMDKVVRPFSFTPVAMCPAGEAEWADAIVAQADEDLSKGALKATIQAVLEPLKVRVISKGNAAPYYLAKLFQKKLHGIMRGYPFFRLIGRRLCPTDLIDLREKSILGGTGPLGWASIDFAAATDNLSASLSKCIMDALTEGFPVWWKDLLLQCLAPHYCEYPPIHVFGGGVETVESIQQANGQLMGSIVSFLVLNLANAGVTLASTAQEDPRDWYSRLSGVLLNGDDNVFAARKSVYDTFSRWAGACGLEMSVGKAYWHPTIVNINSTCFHYNLVDRTSTPKRVSYLNTGLFFGKGKVMGKTDDEVNPRTMTSVINEVVDGARAGKQCDILKQYLALHSDQIADECRGKNLFIPIELGGLGISMPYGWKTEVTQAQQTLAGFLLASNPNLWKTGFGPSISREVEDRPPELDVPWVAPILERSTNKGVGSGIHKIVEKPGFFTKQGFVFRPLGRSKCFVRHVNCDVRRPYSDFVPYKNSELEDDFHITMINLLKESVYTVEELAPVARDSLPRLSVQQRDRDCSIDESSPPWVQFSDSFRLDLEQDWSLNALLLSISWITTW